MTQVITFMALEVRIRRVVRLVACQTTLIAAD